MNESSLKSQWKMPTNFLLSIVTSTLFYLTGFKLTVGIAFRNETDTLAFPASKKRLHCWLLWTFSCMEIWSPAPKGKG
ncbi:hypothetical protein V6N12_019533 [Hibiscus sabdariffa]|uniref:Uncharacterized protein n=1 Tax=Hibiscus sabdariffa TaxID=183260 RepID=A0ABR2BMJ3_9ROSI